MFKKVRITLSFLFICFFVLLNTNLSFNPHGPASGFWNKANKLNYLKKPIDIIPKKGTKTEAYKPSQTEYSNFYAVSQLINNGKKFQNELNVFESAYVKSPHVAHLYYQIVQYYYNKNDKASVEKWAQVYFEKFPHGYDFQSVLSYYRYIKGIYMYLYTQSSFLPGEDASVYLNIQNVKSVDFEVYSVKAQEVNKPLQQIDPYDFKLSQEHVVKKFNKLFDNKYFYGNVSLGKLNAGLYVVIAKTMDITSATIVSVSKLGIISKSDFNKTLLYVVDKISGRPLKDVVIKAFLNQKRIAEGNTDEDGIAVLDHKDQKESYHYYDFIAMKDHDLAFITVYSYNYNTEKMLRSYFYSDRPVYRPGQRIAFKVILRERLDSSHYNVPDKNEYKVVIETPTRKKIYENKIKMNEFGCINDALELDEKAELGWYRYRIFDKDEKEIYNSNYYYNANNAFRVEEYKKPEFKLEFPVIL